MDTPGVGREVDQTLRTAIAGRRIVSFSYQGLLRIAEPHDYGVNKGKVRLFCYQVGGESRSGKLPDWRVFDVPDISNLQLTDESFPGSRLVAGQHVEWESLFASVSKRGK